jgi:hypothetical protein
MKKYLFILPLITLSLANADTGNRFHVGFEYEDSNIEYKKPNPSQEKSQKRSVVGIVFGKTFAFDNTRLHWIAELKINVLNSIFKIEYPPSIVLHLEI